MYRWEVPKILARRLAQIRDRTGVPVARQLRCAVDVDFQEYGTRRVQKHGTPRAPPLT